METDCCSVNCVWKCGVCSAVCRESAIRSGSKGLEIDMARCSKCLICVRLCPAGILGEESIA